MAWPAGLEPGGYELVEIGLFNQAMPARDLERDAACLEEHADSLPSHPNLVGSLIGGKIARWNRLHAGSLSQIAGNVNSALTQRVFRPNWTTTIAYARWQNRV